MLRHLQADLNDDDFICWHNFGHDWHNRHDVSPLHICVGDEQHDHNDHRQRVRILEIATADRHNNGPLDNFADHWEQCIRLLHNGTEWDNNSDLQRLNHCAFPGHGQCGQHDSAAHWQ